MGKKLTAKRRIIVLLSLVATMIVLLSVVFANCLGVSASSDYAAFKGFDIEGFTYSRDKSVNNKPIKSGNTTLGNMSLWLGKYRIFASDSITYTALFIEAKLCATNSNARNSQMVIDIYHIDGKESEIVTYSPTESYGSSTTVSESVEVDIGSDSVSAGYSFDVGRSYPDIDMLCYSYNYVQDDILVDTTRTGVKYVLNWADPSSHGIQAPYHGEIIRKIAVIFKVDFKTNPDYDSDSDTFIVDFKGTLYSGGENHPQSIKFTCGNTITAL